MTIKDFKRRWLNSKIEPELFYMPVRKPLINVVILVHCKCYDITTNNFIEYVDPDSPTRYIITSSIVVLDSNDNIILNEKTKRNYRHNLSIRQGKYKVKVIHTYNGGYVDNIWHEFTVNKDTQYVHIFIPVHIIKFNISIKSEYNVPRLIAKGTYGVARCSCQYEDGSEDEMCPLISIENESELSAKGVFWITCSIDDAIIYDGYDNVLLSGSIIQGATITDGNGCEHYITDQYYLLTSPATECRFTSHMVYPYTGIGKLQDAEGITTRVEAYSIVESVSYLRGAVKKDDSLDDYFYIANDPCIANMIKSTDEASSDLTIGEKVLANTLDQDGVPVLSSRFAGLAKPSNDIIYCRERITASIILPNYSSLPALVNCFYGYNKTYFSQSHTASNYYSIILTKFKDLLYLLSYDKYNENIISEEWYNFHHLYGKLKRAPILSSGPLGEYPPNDLYKEKIVNGNTYVMYDLEQAYKWKKINMDYLYGENVENIITAYNQRQVDDIYNIEEIYIDNIPFKIDNILNTRFYKEYYEAYFNRSSLNTAPTKGITGNLCDGVAGVNPYTGELDITSELLFSSAQYEENAYSEYYRSIYTPTYSDDYDYWVNLE